MKDTTRPRHMRRTDEVGPDGSPIPERLNFEETDHGLVREVPPEEGGIYGILRLVVGRRPDMSVHCDSVDAAGNVRFVDEGGIDENDGRAFARAAALGVSRLEASRRFVEMPDAYSYRAGARVGEPVRDPSVVWRSTHERRADQQALLRHLELYQEREVAWATAMTVEVLKSCGATQETLDLAATARLGRDGQVELLSEAMREFERPACHVETASEMMEPVGYGTDIAGIVETKWERAVAAPYLEAPWYWTTLQDIYEDPVREATNDGVERMYGVNITQPNNPVDNFALALELAQKKLAEEGPARTPASHGGEAITRRL